MLIFLICVVSGITIENKEDQCFLLSSHLVRERHEEAVEIITKQTHLKLPEVRMKQIEECFYYCMEHISEEEVESLMKTKRKEYSQYIHLISADFKHLQTRESIRLSQKFMDKRKEISKRVSTLPKRVTTNDL